MSVSVVCSDLVNEVEGYGSLACTHLFGLEVFKVLSSDGIHAQLQSSSHLVLFPILLTLNKTKQSNILSYNNQNDLWCDSLTYLTLCFLGVKYCLILTLLYWKVPKYLGTALSLYFNY